MEFKTLLLIGMVAAFVITVHRRIAKDGKVDAILVSVVAVLFLLILTVSFLFEDSIVLRAILFGYWAGNAIFVNGDDD